MKTSTITVIGASAAVLVAGGLVSTRPAPAGPTADLPVAWAAAHRVEPTRLLRRGYLALAQRPPTVEEYEALLAVPEAERREAALDRLEALLDGPEFDDVIFRWGIELLRIGSYDFRFDFVNNDFDGHYAVEHQQCPAGTLHAGAYGMLNDLPNWGEPWAMCDDPGADIEEVEPWWAPGTTVRMIGVAGQTEIREVDGVDCGKIRGSLQWATHGCSCGPNLRYCKRPGFPDHDNFDPLSIRRSAFEEPARLLQHIVRNDRPFSDLVLGDYTVVNRGLRFVYYRNARMNGANAFLDDDPWFREFESDTQWKQVRFEEMHPNLLSDRDIRFDPRTEDGTPPGVPAAGVLSTLAANYAFPRERVRGARWLETFACRDFTPPPADVEFHPYQRDPGTEGVCEHCHQLIDPAAMHFKRMYGGGAQLGGIGDWSLLELPANDRYRDRSLSTFEYDTLMTPVDTVRLEENPDAALIDFLPENYTLFGRTGDGTIGPLGFAKLLVTSGEFDRCMVRRVHELVTGRDLVPGRDDPTIEAFVESFVADDRKVKALIVAILRSDGFLIGW
jgi:hypothetical protein